MLIINDSLEEPEAELPAGPEIQQSEQVAFTHLLSRIALVLIVPYLQVVI